MTIHQLKTPCFVVGWRAPEAGDGLAHYGTHAQAEAALSADREDADGDAEVLAQFAAVVVKELPYLCWVAECDAPDGPEGTCGDTLGDEDEGPACVHFETVDELFAWMPGESWTRAGADGALCWTHRQHCLDEQPAGQEIDGQLGLPGVA